MPVPRQFPGGYILQGNCKRNPCLIKDNGETVSRLSNSMYRCIRCIEEGGYHTRENEGSASGDSQSRLKFEKKASRYIRRNISHLSSVATEHVNLPAGKSSESERNAKGFLIICSRLTESYANDDVHDWSIKRSRRPVRSVRIRRDDARAHAHRRVMATHVALKAESSQLFPSQYILAIIVPKLFISISSALHS